MRRLSPFVVALALAPLLPSAAAADPPSIVARISFVSGSVSYRAAAAADWSPAALNYPLTIGDGLWTDRAGRTELQLGATALRLDASTSLSILNLDAHTAQLRLTAGTIAVGVRDLGEDDAIEIDTPNGVVNVLRPGFYRVDVNANGDTTTVTVRHGEAEVAAGPSAFTVRANQSAIVSGLDNPASESRAAMRVDEFEDWASYRDRRADYPATVRYVSRGVVGYEDLDEFGSWRVVGAYGPVWVPHVRVGWTPYRFGHWAWVEPWGWTWIDDAPWGFAPFHYGRWVYLVDGWAWVPGTIVARPVYAPALVAFVGGPGFRVSVSIGQPVAWFPLGPREIYVPAYRVTPEYVRAVNVSHVNVTNVNVTNINVTNITYVNRTVPGAVTAVSRDAFAQARPVAAAAVPVSAAALNGASIVGHAASVEAPARPAVGRPAAGPPAPIVDRSVVVRKTPAPSIQPAIVKAAPAARAPVGVASSSVVRDARPVAAPPRPVDPMPPAPTAKTASPNRAAADVVARHADERIAVESRHAQERAEMLARHREEEQRAINEQRRADLRAQHDRELAALDAKHKLEHEDMQRRHAKERERR
jgi:hypothetical protein